MIFLKTYVIVSSNSVQMHQEVYFVLFYDLSYVMAILPYHLEHVIFFFLNKQHVHYPSHTNVATIHGINLLI